MIVTRSITSFYSFLKKHALKIVMLLLGLEVCFFIFNINLGSAPDEFYHVQLGLEYSKSLSDGLGLSGVQNIPATYNLANITNRPWLYHLFLGIAANLNFLNLPVVVWLRLANLPMAIITFVFIYKTTIEIVSEITSESFRIKLAGLLTLVLTSQVLMFMFLFGAVSYDNLVNMLVVLSFYALVRLIKTDNFKYFLWLGIFTLLGSITKRTFLIFALILGLLVIGYLVRNWKPLWHSLRQPFSFARLSIFNVFLTMALIVLIIANLQLYLGNLLEYQALIPSCAQVIGHENCMMNFNYSTHFQQMLDVEAGTSNFEYGFLEYVLHWVVYMVGSIFGIRAFPYYYVNHLHSVIFMVLGLVAGAIFLFKKQKQNFEKIIIFATTLFSAIVFLYNWTDYLETAEIGRTAHGRYLLPVLPLVLIFLSVQLVKTGRKRLLKAFVIILSVVLFLTGFLNYYLNQDEEIKMNWKQVQVKSLRLATR